MDVPAEAGVLPLSKHTYGCRSAAPAATSSLFIHTFLITYTSWSLVPSERHPGQALLSLCVLVCVCTHVCSACWVSAHHGCGLLPEVQLWRQQQLQIRDLLAWPAVDRTKGLQPSAQCTLVWELLAGTARKLS